MKTEVHVENKMYIVKGILAIIRSLQAQLQIQFKTNTKYNVKEILTIIRRHNYKDILKQIQSTL